MPDFRRGADAIAEAQKKAKAGGGNFQAFTPEFFWKDGDEKFLLFLNPLSDIPTADVISFIPVSAKKADGEKYTRYERVIARTDPVIGDDHDGMVDDWDGKPRATCIAAAVELEPTYTEVKGRKRPNGFSVKTREFDRRIRDEDGELTDEYETVVAPEVALIHASPNNFFNVVTSYDENDAPIEDTPLKITRVGGDQNTVYTVTGYPELSEVDLSALVDNIDNVNYLYSDIEDILKGIDGLEEAEAAQFIGAALLDKRLDELVDGDRHERLLGGITETLDKFGGKSKGKGKPSSKSERPSRRTQRKSEAPAEEAADEPGPASEPVAEEAPKRRARASKPDTATETAVDDKVAAMRARLEKRKTAAA